jgi:hypothetical protein
MRTCMAAPMLSAVIAASTASAHGPQIQITKDNNKIVTRQVIAEEPYSDSLTPPASVYVMPVLEFGGVWYSRPNNKPSATIPGAPEYPSGPGLAYGYDRADGGPQAFAEASVLSVTFTDPVKHWNGLAFVDAAGTQLKAFRGSNPTISMPAESFAITSDGPPFDSVSFAPIAADYGADAHSSLQFALLGNGSSPTTASPDGVYLLGLQASSSQSGLNPSDPYFFVLYKNAPMSQVVAAVHSLGMTPSSVQWVVPEPTCVTLAAFALLFVVRLRNGSKE